MKIHELLYRRVPLADRAPWWMGCLGHSFSTRSDHYCIWPLNWPAFWLGALWWCVQHPWGLGAHMRMINAASLHEQDRAEIARLRAQLWDIRVEQDAVWRMNRPGEK